MPPRAEAVSARFELDAAALGIATPPFPLRARVLWGSRCWSAYTQAPDDESSAPIVTWLASMRPRRIEFGSRNVIRADFDVMPEPWASIVHEMDIDLLKMAPGEPASLTVRGSRAAMHRFVERMQGGNLRPSLRHVGAAQPRSSLLTHPQEEALQAAVRSGYYLIPRPINLHDLGRGCGVTAASLSERLRRAEARVLTRYVRTSLLATSPDLGDEPSGEAWDVHPMDFSESDPVLP